MHHPFIFKLVDSVGDVLGDTFPEIRQRADHIKSVIESEEVHFNRTLDRGLEIFDKIKTGLRKKKQILIPGADVFKLYDTYGFPLDLTRVLADESGLKLDTDGFEKEMKQQQERARKAAKFKAGNIPTDAWVVLDKEAVSNFVGYTEDAIETHIIKYSIQENNLNIVLKDTPFYAEAGGQVGDTGKIVLEGFDLAVLDTQKEGDDIIHLCRLPENFELKSDRVLAEIKTDNRRYTEKNHTATHLLHAALRKVLGDHVQQAGSLVEPERMRFDFTHFKKVSDKELNKIEIIVNEKIQQDLELEIEQDSFDNAKKRGAMALFGEKYGDVVRTIQISDYSLELCGGTHVRHTGEIGPFIIVYEGSIASGIRRIEALTGKAAVSFLQLTRNNVNKLSEILNTPGSEIVERINELVEQNRTLEKKLSKISSEIVVAGVDAILKNAEKINGINVISHELPDTDIDKLKELGDKIREKSQNTVALLGSKVDGKIGFVCVVTDDLIKSRKLKAGDLVREVAKIAGGGGGGRPHLATAGGKDIEKFSEAMEKIKALV